mmetsp:Transcript_38891/g.40312  ORF Transcript_38891/g.40312 Transcript_38891/m.40312 type:complete len:568 (-) Transcript_38891:69-1772(-)
MWKTKYILLFAFLSAASVLSQSSSLISIFEQLEADTKSKAEKIAQDFSQRCSDTCTGSINSCSNSLPNTQCFSEFNIEKCTDCNTDTPGLLLSGSSTLKLADLFYPSTDANAQNVKEAACASQKAEAELKNGLSNLGVKWRFIGTYNGLYRNYPGVQSCGSFDPRVRPWYVGAATGAKNVVLIMDISGSMNEGGKMDIAKEAAKKVVDSLNNFDWIGVVTFSTNSNKYKDQLIRVTNDNKIAINNWIDGLSATGSTNFETAFRAGYDIFSSSKGDELGTGCENLIIFLTDGEVVEGITNADELLNLINTLDSGHSAQILTYSLGAEADKTVTKKIACAKNGLFQDVQDSLRLQQAMNSYYLLLSAGLRRTQAVWSEPYEDFLGMGLITTVSYPIYDDTQTPPFLIGAFGQDIVMKDLEQYDNYNSILNAFISRSKQCNTFGLSDCQMNSFREVKCDGVSTNCNSVLTSLPTCTSSGRTFAEGQTLSNSDSNVENECCGDDSCSSSTGAIVGGIVGGIVVIVIIVVVTVMLCKKKEPEIHDNNKNAQSNQQNAVSNVASDVHRPPGAH